MSAPADSTETMSAEQRDARENMIRIEASIDCYKKRIAFDQQALAALEARQAELLAKSQGDSRVRRYTRALAELAVPDYHIGLLYWGPVAPNTTVVFCRLVRATEIQECKSADPDKVHVLLVDNNRTLPVDNIGCNIVWINPADPAHEQHFAEAYRRVVSVENIPRVFGIEIREYKVNGKGAFASSFRGMTDRSLLAWTNDLQSIRTLTESHPRTSLVTSKVRRSATPQLRRPGEIAATELATTAGTAAAAARMAVANMRGGANRQSVDSSDEDLSTSGASAGTSQASSWVVHPREEDASVQSGAAELQNLMTYSNLSAK